jgi:hypothetical protein
LTTEDKKFFYNILYTLPKPLTFEILARDKKSKARAGIIHTPNGNIQTPYLVPVATRGSIIGVSTASLKKIGIQCLFANAYHLHFKPGDKKIRTKTIDQNKNNRVQEALNKEYPPVSESRFETVGPTVGAELTRNAILAVVVASLFIVVYIAWSFRAVPKPASSWKFGVTAVAALLHDALFYLQFFHLANLHRSS